MLVDALHWLHHRAGWPSLRVLAREAGCSHTTFSSVFSSSRLPSWGVLELLVEAMHGDVDTFREVWLAAGSREGAGPVPPTIAGREEEVTRTRLHLTGLAPGLLLVSGEAGMGKARLVTTATALSAGRVFIAAGSCLPLSTDVPLLPVADALRSVYECDDGQWLKEAVAECAPYTAGSLRRVLPELDQLMRPEPEPDAEWSRQRSDRGLGPARAASRRGVLPVARRSGSDHDRPGHGGGAVAAPGRTRCPGARPADDGHRRDFGPRRRPDHSNELTMNCAAWVT